jgi:unspecific monooxygenase
MRTRIQSVVDGLIDGFAGAGEVDLIADFAEPLPVTVIAELLGIPEADRHHLRPWSADFCLMYELNPSDDSARRAVRASEEFGAYLRELLAERRARPGGDLISALAAVVDDGDTLTETELVATCVLLLNAGHEASVSGAGNGWWTLFRHATPWRLRAEPDLLPSAIEELLRFDTPLSLFERWVLDPIEIDGLEIRVEVALLFGSANRDPAAFRDLTRWTSPAILTRTVVRGGHPLLPDAAGKLELGRLRTAVGSAAGAHRDAALKPTFVLRGLEALRGV